MPKRRPLSTASETVLLRGARVQDVALRLVLLFLPALMAAILSGVLSTAAALKSAQGTVAQSVQIVLMPSTDAARDHVSEATDTILSVLVQNKLVAKVEQMPQAQVAQLLGGGAGDALPVLLSAQSSDPQQLSAAIKSQAAQWDLPKDIELMVESPDAFLQTMSARLKQAMRAALVVSGVLFAIAIAIVVAVVQARLLLQSGKIRLLHHLGADDQTIMTEMAKAMMVLSVPSVTFGVAGGALAGIFLVAPLWRVGAIAPFVPVGMAAALLAVFLVLVCVALTAGLTRHFLRLLP